MGLKINGLKINIVGRSYGFINQNYRRSTFLIIKILTNQQNLKNLTLLNFIQNFFIAIFGLLAISSILRLSYSSNKDGELSKYKIDECSPDTFISNQQGIFKNIDSDRGISVIRPLNVGVSEEGLYLFQPSPYNILFPSLLIPWDEIEYQKPTDNGNMNKPYTLCLGNPKVTSVRL